MIKEKMKQLIGKSINKYNTQHVKDVVNELKFKEQYQGRIIDCMVGEVDDNYIETPETDSSIVKLEHSKEGLIKVPSIKGKTILVDSEGNETDTPGEGCRLVSVGEEDNKLIILSKNKNLFDINKFKDPNNWITKGTSYRSFEIKLKPNTEYCFSRKDNSGYGLGAHILINTDAGSYVGSLGWIMHSDSANINMQKGKFVTPDNGIIYLSFIPNGIDAILNAFKEFQIELGKTPTSYIEPKHHKTEILLNEPLKQGDLIEGNKHYIKYKKVIFDGSEKWNSFKDNGNTVSAMIGKLQYKKLADVKSVNTQFKNYSIPYSYNQSDTEHFYMDANFVLYLSKDRGIISLDSFKEYLSNNNFELIVELAEPIIEELPNSITIQGFDDTTMYIENSITPTVTYGYNALIPYKEELLNQKEEVETNTLDIEQNIIPYLMDMEFNLMLMEDE